MNNDLTAKQRTNQSNRALALAGVFQAAYLVKQLAWKASIDQKDLETEIYSLFQINATSVSAVYGGAHKVKHGLQTLINLLQDARDAKDPEIARYTISLLHLERLLIKKSSMLNAVQRGISRAQHQAEHFSLTHENVLANIASIYTDTVSTFNFRIHVSGEGTCLSNTNNVNKIRTILLAGIRSAVLWRQLGGSRWQLIFGKKTLLADARELLREIAIETEVTS